MQNYTNPKVKAQPLLSNTFLFFLLTFGFLLLPTSLYADSWNVSADGQTATLSDDPYSDNQDFSTTLSIPGAATMQIKIEGVTEATYDFVYITDASGTTQSFTGGISNIYTVTGDTITIRFTSDFSVTPSGGVIIQIIDGVTGFPPCIATTGVGTDGTFRNFCQRVSFFATGSMLSIGNTFTVAPNDDTTTADCDTYTNGTYIDPIGTNNSNRRYCHYSADGVQGAASSIAELPVPVGSTIRWAGLYWQGIGANPVNVNSLSIDIRNNNSGTGYQSASALRVDYDASYSTNISPVGSSAGATSADIYAAFADVTQLFQDQNWTDGNYTVRTSDIMEGQETRFGVFSAWNLIVIYENPNETTKSFTIFDGWQQVSSSNPNVPVNISGFYTPKQTPINATLGVFAGEGDYTINGDVLTADRQSDGTTLRLTNSNNAGATNQTFSSLVDIDGSFRLPTQRNNNGIDIQKIDIGSGTAYDLLETEQTSMNFNFTSTGDLYFPSMIAFSTEVYVPQFCYDYDYEQFSTSFRNDNNGTAAPTITGTILGSNDVNVTLYIRNQEDSDVLATNMLLNITDINTSQAAYRRDSTYVTYPNTVIPTSISDGVLSVADSYIRNIPINDVSGKEYYYTSYTLDTSNLGTQITDINVSINATMSYDLIIPVPNAAPIVIPTITSLGGEKTPLCSATINGYIPVKGRFNVVDSDLYNYPTEPYYNIPTQVTQRPGNFKVVSFDPDNLDTQQGLTSIVGVDMVHIENGYGDMNATCNKEDKKTSGRVWVIFDNNASEIELDISQAIADGMVDDVASIDDFYQEARQDAVFRISYNTTNDGNDSLIDLTEQANGDFLINNYVELVQNIGTCASPVRFNPSTSTTTLQVAAVCGNSGAAGVSPWMLARCQECLFGFNTKRICSRDNFSIRPESYNVKIKDLNQTNENMTSLFADDRTGVALANTNAVDLSGGYVYKFDVNATSHQGNAFSPRYLRYFGNGGNDYNSTLEWTPDVTLARPTPNIDCNDTTSKNIGFNLSDGFTTDQNGSLDQVGHYRLNIVDKTWTEVDWNATLMPAHSDTTHYVRGLDCLAGNTRVLNTGAPTSIVNNALSNINGCIISTDEHNNTEASIQYRDYNLSFRPYKFNIDGLSLVRASMDMNQTLDQNNSYLYMNSLLNVTDDMNMSTRFIGVFFASGHQNQQLTNFTQGCYSEDVDLDFITSPIPTVSVPPFEYRLREMNATTLIGDDIRGSNLNAVPSMRGLVTLPDGNFSQVMLGSANIELAYSFGRTTNQAYNPIILNYNDFNVTCNPLSSCQSQADFSTTHDSNGTLSADPTAELATPLIVTHLYARSHVPRHRVNGPIAAIPINYEFYCDSDATSLPVPCNIGNYIALPSGTNSISPNALLSPDDVRWYTQAEHNTSVDGNVTFTNTRQGTSDLLFLPDTATNMDVDLNRVTLLYQYNAGRGYPYKVTMETGSPDWLIYNRYDTRPTVNAGGTLVNEFELEFTRVGGWVGLDRSGMQDDTNASSITNRRIQW